MIKYYELTINNSIYFFLNSIILETIDRFCKWSIMLTTHIKNKNKISGNCFPAAIKLIENI